MKAESYQENMQPVPCLWHWSQPEEGNSLEDCEKIVRDYMSENRGKRLWDLPVMFV